MARVCDITGRRTRVGHQVTRRGLAKKKGGVGRRVTGRAKRTFKPNIHTVRVLTPDGSIVHMKLSAKAIKKGVIVMQQNGREVRFPLIKALRGRNRAFSKAQKPAATAPAEG
jgi:large subunit ribosomal protein L28